MTTKYGLLVFCTLLVMIAPVSALSASGKEDAYEACMNRTKKARLDCQVGCGMILQQCYDEGVAGLNANIEKLKQDLKINGEACVRLAANYLAEASRMESSVEQSGANLVGWMEDELALSFARQRLFNLKIIKRMCTQ